MSGLVVHAEKELKIAGMFDKDSDYGGMTGEAVMELIRVFAKQGHSGYSASIVSNLFHKLASYETITPLTGEDGEWNEVSDVPKGIMYQNNRNSAVFKNSKDGKSYYVDAIVWRTQKGLTYTGRADGIRSAQYIKSFPFIPKTFVIDVNEVEIAKDDCEFHIIDYSDLNKVWEKYDKWEKDNDKA